VCVRNHKSAGSIIAAFEARVGNDAETEFATALEEIGQITRLRLEGKLQPQPA
jgi:2-oxo-4-hydroxy-4-carboxy-5-ureidoimidazoline decarboxylase